MISLNVKAWLRYACLAVVMGLLLFIPAGTVRYWQAWVFLAAFFAPAALMGVYLARHDPALMQRRLRGGPLAERENRTKDHHDRDLDRIRRPPCGAGARSPLRLVEHAALSCGCRRCPRGGRFLHHLPCLPGEHLHRGDGRSRAGSARRHDRAICRHPQYAGALLYLIGMPLAVGSFWGLLVFAAIVPMLIWRLVDEERLLGRELPGYREYQQRVRWRLIPAIF